MNGDANSPIFRSLNESECLHGLEILRNLDLVQNFYVKAQRPGNSLELD